MTDLKHDTQYYYRVGDSAGGWSETYSFNTKETSPIYAVYGDFGLTNDVSLAQLTAEAEAGEFDAVLHVGEFAYDLHTGGGRVGDQFLQALQPVSANKPYMTCPGNHEAHDNFTHYKHRFSGIESGVGSASGSHTNLWWSMDVDNVHFVAIDTEVYAYSRNQGQIDRQLAWLQQDLAAANNNRQQVPWIVMFGHKAWDMDNTNWTGFAHLAHRYGVDVYLCGHVHNYERYKPVNPMNGDVDKQQDKGVYVDPKYMVTLVAGSLGCQEDINSSDGITGVAFESKTYGYGHLQFLNATHMYWNWEQTKGDLSEDDSVLDTLWLVQNHHGLRD